MLKRILIGLALLAAVALGVAIHRFNQSGVGAPLAGETRADFVRSTIDGCAARQKAAPGNQDLDPSVIDRFCACYADELVRKVTTADLDRLRGRPEADIQRDMRPRMDEADRVCLEKINKD